MKCIFCGGKVVTRKVTFIYDYDKEYFLVENVPAEVCLQCGERTYAPEVTDELLRFARKKVIAQKTVELPVFNYADEAIG